MKTPLLTVALVLSGPLFLGSILLSQPAEGPRRGPGPDGPRPPTLPIITALDANNDGTIDAGEISQAPAALKKLDANQDGKIAPEEYRPQRRGQPGPGGGPGAGPGRGGRGPGMSGGGESFNATTLPKDDAEKEILEILTQMNETQRRGNMTVPEQDGRILRLLTESLGAQHVVEVGTSIGYSGTWFCLGLTKTGGKLTTFEIDAQRAAQARENFKTAGVEGMVRLIEGDAHEEVSKVNAPIDILFLDADKEGYLDYLEKLLPKLRPGGLVVAHNINQQQADPRYIKAITTNPSLETLFLNLETSGIAVSMKKR